MPSHSTPASNPAESSSDTPNDAVSLSSASSLHSELSLAKAQSTTILLPSQLESSHSSPSCTALNPNLNYRPVIGILSNPGDGASGRLTNASGTSYIAASYVKFVESAGARVIPLIYNEPSDVLFQVITSVI